MNTIDAHVQTTRAWAGLLVVIIGDLAVAIAATLGLTLMSGRGVGTEEVVSILSAAFTTIGTLTTAYFGIRAASNASSSPPPGFDQSTGTPRA